jgi:hypothetical protein
MNPNMHVFPVEIADYGPEEVAFFAVRKEDAEREFRAWLDLEPYVAVADGLCSNARTEQRNAGQPVLSRNNGQHPPLLLFW